MKTKIYLIPGLMNDERLWTKLKDYLSDFFDLVYLSIPKGDGFDEIIKAFEFKEKKINLIGFSLGAYISSYYTIKNSKKVNKLMLISSSICSNSKEEIQRRKETLKQINHFGFKGISRKKVSSLLDDEENEELIKLIQDMYESLGLDNLNLQMNNVFKRIDLKEELLNLDTKISFFYGNKDRLINQQWLEDFRKISKNSEFKVFNSKSHMLPLEKPYELSLSIKEHFKE